MACLWLPSSFFPIWYFFYHLGKVLDNFSTKYDRFVLLGDFNGQESETILSEFLNACNAKYIVKKTCFKSIENPSCIDLIITDKPGTFQHTNVFETGISDHHKLVTTVMKAKFTMAAPNYVYYDDYKNKNWGVNWKLMLLIQIMRLFTMPILIYLISMLP